MFLNAAFAILIMLVLLCGFMPTAMAIDHARTALKAGHPAWPWVCMSLLSFLLLAIAAFLSMAGLLVGVFPSFIFTLNGGDLLPAVLASTLTLAGPWVVWVLGSYWIEKKVTV